MRLGDLLKGPHGPKSDIDGFTCDFQAPENRGHAMLERYAIEVVAIQPDWSTDIALKKFDAGRAILEASPEDHAVIALAAVERAVWIHHVAEKQRVRPHYLPAVGERISAMERVPGTVLKTLTRRRFGFTSEQAARAMELMLGINGLQLGWQVPLKGMLAQMEDGTRKGPLDAGVRAGLERLRSHLAKFDSAGLTEIKVRIEQLLAGGAPRALFDGAERWVQDLVREAAAMPEPAATQWASLYEHLLAASAQKPSRKWLTLAAALRDTIGASEYQERALAILDAVQGNGDEPIAPRNADYIKGLIWTLAEWATPDAVPRLASRVGDLALAAARKIPDVGMRSVKVVNACIGTLGRMPGTEPLAQLTRLRMKIKAQQQQKLITSTLEEAARGQGMAMADLEELVTPTFGMQEPGLLTEVLGDWTAELRIVGTASVELRWLRADGKAQKSLPKAVQSDYAAEVKELKAAAQEIGRMLGPQRDRIERLMIEERSLPVGQWRERYLDHPLVGPLSRRLIWRVDDGERTVLAAWHDGALLDVAGRPLEDLSAGSRVSLWHPLGTPVETVLAWRRWLEQHGVVQPFKQAHREIYILTDAELATATYSNRFAAHILKQHQFVALCRARGWRAPLQGGWDNGGTTPVLELPRHGLRAEYWVEACLGTRDALTEAGIAFHVTTDQLRFSNAAGESVPLREVPSLVFSETMRDVDLFVGVSSVGADPAWQPGGERQEWSGYWQSYAFGELSATAQTRREVLERLIPRLRIADRCRIEGRFLEVRGALHTYRIHLGSGNILMMPDSRYLCIVADRGVSARQDDLWLPFEGDGLMSVILSKAFLLADDTAITDPTIVRQIRG